MNHQMKLNSAPFSDVRNGTQKVEVRLFDEKRQKVSIDDIIEFRKLPKLQEAVTVRVEKIKRYTNFRELVDDVSLELFGARYLDKSEILQEGSGYDEKEERKYGFVVFTISLENK